MKSESYTYDGKEFSSIRDLASYTGVHEKTLTARIRRGMSIDEKCTIVDVSYGYPRRIFTQKNETKEIFQCYDGFGCYELNEYQMAFEDAQIQEDRIIY